MFHVDQRGSVRRRVLGGVLLATATSAVLLGGGAGGEGDGGRAATPATPRLELASTQDPAPPTAVVITPGDGQFTRISWTASSEPKANGYQIYVGDTLVQTVTGTATTAPITGLTNGTDYPVRVVTRTASGFLGSSIAYGRTPATATGYPSDGVAPAAPTGVTAARGDGQVQLSWAANGEADLVGYRVLRDGQAVSGTLTGPAWTDTGLTNDTTYRYTVQALDTSRQWSASSAPAVAATPTDLTPPATPLQFLAERGDRQVTLSWQANRETDLASYRVLRDGVEVGVVAGSARGWTDTGLTNDQAYRYSLVAVDAKGNRSAATTPVTSTPTDLTPPAAPTGLSVVQGDGELTLTWTANAETDLASYRVLRDGAEVAVVTGTTWTDTGLANDARHAYRLVAVDTHGNLSTASAEVGAAPTDLTAPATPAAPTAVAGDGRVDLTWTAGADPDLAGHRLYRDGVLLTTTTGTTWADTGLVNGTEHAYRLVAVDTHGNASTASDVVTARPVDRTPPAAPTGVLAQGLDSVVRLTWDLSPEADVDWYVVRRDGVELTRVDGMAGDHQVEDRVANDVDHDYDVLAVDLAGNVSAPSATVRARGVDLTAPAVPTGTTAMRGDGQVTLAWTANAETDLASYRVLRDGVEVATVTGTSWTDTGLVNGRQYGYRLTAVDTHGNVSPPSAEVVATPADLTPPAGPADLTAVPGDGRVDLAWTADGEAVTYRVLRDGVEVAAVTGTSWTDTGLVDDRTYTYEVVAEDAAGNRSAVASTTATPTDLTPPDPPTAPVATAGERQVALTWAPSPSADVVSHRVLRDGVEVAAPAGPSTTLTGLAPGTPVALTVVAVDGHGNVSAPTAVVTATPYDRTAPAPPTGLTTTAGTGSATVAWTAPADPDALSYRVLRDGVPVATVTASPAVLTGLAEGSTASVTVVAVDPSGNASPPSAPVVVTPLRVTVPAQGSGQTGGLAVSGDGRYVVVGTRARLEATDTNTAYELYRLDRVAGTATRIAPLGASATGATDPTNAAAPAVSADGRYVALATTAALVPADTNGLADVYRRDLQTGTWALVSVPVGGRVHPSVPGTELQPGSSVDATSPAVVMSADGDLVLFYSARSDLGPADTDTLVDVYAKRMSTGAVTRVSATPTGGQLPRAATGPALALTPDGRFALFPAVGSSGPVVLYRATLSGAGAGGVTVVSRFGSTEVGVYRDTGDVDLSDDGRYVAFVSSARPGSPGQSWSTGLAYRADTVTGAVQPLGTGQTSAWEHQVALDPTGRYGFLSTTAPLIAGDSDAHTDVFRRDLDTGTLVLVTADQAGRQTAGPGGSVTAAEYPRVVPVTGDLVVLATSEALVPGDTNRVRDLYVKDLVTGAVLSPVA